MNTLDEEQLKLAAQAINEKAELLEKSGQRWEARKHRITADKIISILQERESSWIASRLRQSSQEAREEIA